MRDLGAHRTAALQAALVRSRQVALSVLAHPMAETVFGRHGHGNDIVRVTTSRSFACQRLCRQQAAAVLSQAESEWG